MTVLLRSGTETPADDVTPQIPALVQIQNRLLGRPLFAAQLPLNVERELYEIAEQEMRWRMKDRGYANLAHANLFSRNFLFNGVPIVCEACED